MVTGKLFDSASNDQVLTVATSICGSIAQPSALSLYTTRATGQTQEELAAEEHFKDTVKRNEIGRFVVRLPLKRDPAALGNSLQMATKRFFNLELKFVKDDQLAKQYAEFMLEYLQLKHMKLAKDEDNTQGSYYLPHHAVIKEASRTTKTRVVFDASATTTSNISLNDILLKGPTVQPTLFSTLLRFRLHKIALTTDIEKMYRQILVDPQDCSLQTICYRSNPTEPLNKYQLCTVTYGMKSAPFLATRCLVELSNSAPSTSSQRAIRYDFYVDDLLSGANTDEECYNLHKEVSNTLDSAGMPLRKWCTSSKSLINQLPSSQNDPNYLLQRNEDETISTLGITWSPNSDSFKFILKSWDPPIRMTKRSLLADINRIYDPLGFITPVLIKGKIFLQKLWMMKMDWDTTVPDDLKSQWIGFYRSMTGLQNLSISRCVSIDDLRTIQIHGFSDAS